MGKFDVNPFDRSALTDVRMLAGRKNELKQIRFTLRNSTKQVNRIKSVLLSGDRGVGKTSFLNLIEQECKVYNLIPVRLNLTDSNSENSNEFFWYLFSQLINKVFELGFLQGKGGLIDKSIQKILYSDGLSDMVNYVFYTPILRKNYLQNQNVKFEFDKLIKDLIEIRKAITEVESQISNDKTKIYFLVDESQKIYDNLKIIEDIRYIIQHQDIGIGFIFAGDTTYSSLIWEKVFGGSQRDFEIINLGLFKESEDVQDYFKKSLETIDWTDAEIEKDLFYKFKDACRKIFLLSSGKPSWINIVAQKMFERCMNGESTNLRFDSNAKNDLKKLLEDAGQIDRNLLRYIEGLTPRYQRWLNVLFSCELSSFNEVYFYTKFYLIGENALTKEQFLTFCQELVNKKILLTREFIKEDSVGFKRKDETDFLEKPYLAFGPEIDSIKQWILLTTEGKASFRMEEPIMQFWNVVNSENLYDVDKRNTRILGATFEKEWKENRLKESLDKINDKNYSLQEESFGRIYQVYQYVKTMGKSKKGQILCGKLVNLTNGSAAILNSYNYDDNGRLIEFSENKTKNRKYIETINSFNTPENSFELEITIDEVEKVDIENLQKKILQTTDSKKIGIIIEDKEEELVSSYISKKDLKLSLESANFFYQLHEDGIDLSVRCLNNTGYVFIANNQIEKAESVLKEAKRKLSNEITMDEEFNTNLLVNYNLSICNFLKGLKEKSFDGFLRIISIIEEKEKQNDLEASVLNIIEIDENGCLVLKEISEGDKEYPKINIREFCQINIERIQSVIEE